MLIRIEWLSEREQGVNPEEDLQSLRPSHVTARTVLEAPLGLEAMLGAGVHPPPGFTFHLDEEAFMGYLLHFKQ